MVMTAVFCLSVTFQIEIILSLDKLIVINQIIGDVMNKYLFLFISYFLLFTSIPPLLLMLLCLCYMLLPNPICPFPFPYPWLNLIHSLPFHYLSIAFPKVWSDIHPSIVPSHFLSFPYFHSILLSSVSHHHLTLSDPKSCTGLSPYSHYLCSTQS